jgi:hypothetical protein
MELTKRALAGEFKIPDAVAHAARVERAAKPSTKNVGEHSIAALQVLIDTHSSAARHLQSGALHA